MQKIYIRLNKIYSHPLKAKALSLALNALVLWQMIIDASARRPRGRGLHLPVQFGLIYSMLTFGLLAILPPPGELTARALLPLAAGIFCLTFILSIALPRPAYSNPMHWIHNSP